MIELDGGVILPLPRNSKGFLKPEDISDWKWRKMKPELWDRAYTHCLYSLPLHFDLPLHSVVPRIAKKMLEASDPFNVALRFMGEMEIAGYITLERGFDERVVTPTKKFLKLVLDCERAPKTAVTFPVVAGFKELPETPIRGGIASPHNKFVASIAMDMAEEEFKINTWILELVKSYPPEFDKSSSAYMYKRAIRSADIMAGLKFMFPYFLDSRSRMYTDTTCGFNPQGADYEKALVVPTYSETLTNAGFNALVETARGYSEMDWDITLMAQHGKYPDFYAKDWMQADKPYCYMACAKMLSMFLDNPSVSLPAFIPLDGRCSGLQHWSAVVRSNAITRHLGMHEEEDPLDIYEKVASDWKSTLPMDHIGFATRKAAKVPVMTWAYNATMMTSMEHMKKLFGAKSVWDDDAGMYVTVGEGEDRAICGKLGADLYRQLQDTLGALQGAVEWVSNSAAAISSGGNADITWPTPDGFTCMQRKVKGEKKDLDCKLSNGKRFTLDILDFSKAIPNTGKHKSAIAPNIIHSLDATHLRMVARRLKELGLPMIFIHDSFATHVNYRDILYEIIVDTFIELYSRNYLAELRDYWEGTYNVDLSDPPPLGDWEPESLRGLNRFFV